MIKENRAESKDAQCVTILEDSSFKGIGWVRWIHSGPVLISDCSGSFVILYFLGNVLHNISQSDDTKRLLGCINNINTMHICCSNCHHSMGESILR